MEESLGQWRTSEDAATDGTSRLTEDRHLRGVATEVLDVTLHPLQGEDLIQQTIVARVSVLRLLRQFWVCHET